MKNLMIIPKRIDRISPLHATRMGPAIRHTITKLSEADTKSKFLFLISDGRPQDRGYSREGVEKEYAVHDTRQSLIEAKNKGIIPFCLTVDKSGHDYMKTMMEDFSYEVLTDISMCQKTSSALQKSNHVGYLYKTFSSNKVNILSAHSLFTLTTSKVSIIIAYRLFSPSTSLPIVIVIPVTSVKSFSVNRSILT